jgi:hypothetical protein
MEFKIRTSTRKTHRAKTDVANCEIQNKQNFAHWFSKMNERMKRTWLIEETGDVVCLLTSQTPQLLQSALQW